MNKNLFSALWLVLPLSALPLQSASVSYDFFNSGTLLVDNNNSVLSGGTSTDGNGAVIQIGFFSSSSLVNPLGTAAQSDFVVLAGLNSINSGLQVFTVGDTNANEAADGNYAFTITFDDSVVGRNNFGGITSSNTFALRFYNSSSIDSSTHYNTVSSSSANWAWIAPAGIPPATTPIDLADGQLVWQASGTPFQTSLAISSIPEFSTYSGMLGIFALGMVIWSKRGRA